MSDFMRVQVATYKLADLPIDWITNTVYFKKVGGDVGDPNWQEIAEDVAELFGTYRSKPAGYNTIRAKVYDMEDALPRPIVGEHVFDATPYATGGNSSPREVSLCLSFYAERNLPRNRGRIYIGPWAGAVERPAAGDIAWLTALRTGLANIGGVNIEWCVYSPTTPGGLGAQFKQVSAGWIDNEWDTQRSRGLRATTRNPWTMEG